jgi:hypothetical protein
VRRPKTSRRAADPALLIVVRAKLEGSPRTHVLDSVADLPGHLATS